MLEGATGLRYDNVTYRDAQNGDEPTRLFGASSFVEVAVKALV